MSLAIQDVEIGRIDRSEILGDLLRLVEQIWEPKPFRLSLFLHRRKQISFYLVHIDGHQCHATIGVLGVQGNQPIFDVDGSGVIDNFDVTAVNMNLGPALATSLFVSSSHQSEKWQGA